MQRNCREEPTPCAEEAPRSYRVARGGSFSPRCEGFLRSAFRSYGNSLTTANDRLGFRLARTR